MEANLSQYQPLYENLKYWLPLVSTFVMFWKGGKAVRNWADQLLNNHLHSIQESTKETVSVLKEVRDDSKKTLAATELVRTELADARQAGALAQEKLLGGIEALKMSAVSRRRTR